MFFETATSLGDLCAAGELALESFRAREKSRRGRKVMCFSGCFGYVLWETKNLQGRARGDGVLVGKKAFEREGRSEISLWGRATAKLV